MSHARPTTATALHDAAARMTETGALPTGRPAEQVRRAYARGTLNPTTLALLRANGAGDSWLAPRRSALARNLAALMVFVAMNGRVPREGETAPEVNGSSKTVGPPAGRWLRDLRAVALKAGPDSADQQLLDSIEQLAVSIANLWARQ